MINKCKTCKHREICKYTDEYEARFEKLEALKDPIQIFSSCLDCKYYEAPITASDLTKPYRPLDLVDAAATTKTECQECDFYNNYIRKGREYAFGSTPCQGCSHNPASVTYATN